MAALTAARFTKKRNEGAPRDAPIAADIIYAGAIVMFDDDGYLSPALSESDNIAGCVGIATETVDNSAGSAGDKRCKFVECDALVAVGDTMTQAAVGEPMWVSDDQTVVKGKPGSDPVAAGIAVEFVSASEAWIKLAVGLSNAFDTDT